MMMENHVRYASSILIQYTATETRKCIGSPTNKKLIILKPRKDAQ